MKSSRLILDRLFSLEGSVAVVAGGGGRIGRHLCCALAEAGAAVCVLDIDAAAATEAAEDAHRRSSAATLAIAADCTQPSQLEQAARRVTEELGAANILVNAAQFRGPGFYSSSIAEYPVEIWRKVIDVNLSGVFFTCQAFGRRMAQQGGGVMVNLASTYGLVSPDPRIYGDSGVNSPPAYAASKAGVMQLTRYLAVHWREQNIRVNCLVPGGVFDGQHADFVAEYCRRTPLGRMAEPEDYQGAVLFMVSNASRYMTGAVITVDGGWTAW